MCPLATACAAGAAGNPETLPRQAPKKPRPTRYGTAFWAVRPDGAILIRRREERGLLGGMMEIPSTGWRDRPWNPAEAAAAAPVQADWRGVPGIVHHTFTHFHLELAVLVGQVGARGSGVWALPDRLSDYALPTVMKKVVRHALTKG